MEEYVFENLTLIAWQKHMNQWRHDYKLDILSSRIYKDGTVTILLKRTKKK